MYLSTYVTFLKRLFVATAFMEINGWCLGLRIYVIKALSTS